MKCPRRPRSPLLALAAGALLTTSLACTPQPDAPTRDAGSRGSTDAKASTTATTDPAPDPEDSATGDEDDPYSGESAHVIPFSDRTSMGYLLLLPADPELRGKAPETPTREQLRALVQAGFSERRNDAELELMFRLIDTEPHATDIAFDGELGLPNLDLDDSDAGTDSAAGANTPDPDNQPNTQPNKQTNSEAELEALAAKAERKRAFDLLGLHIEVLRIGLGDQATIPANVLQDPILTRDLSPEQRASLPGRQWALLLRADYRNQHGLRGLRLHQTLVRIVAEHYGALIHDPDTLETVGLETFTERRLRAAAGNVADQLAIVPFPDPTNDALLRLGTRGMRRFGAVDLELAGLPRDPALLQQATDFLAGLALVLAQEGEVDSSGLAVQVPEELEVSCALMRQSYAGHEGEKAAPPPPCSDAGSVVVHLVERRPEDHDPRNHVVARVVAPRSRSDAPDYDHPQWVRTSLAAVFGTP